MDEVLAALHEQHDELSGVLGSLSDAGWHAPTRCAGWDVADVVLHLVQTDGLAVASASGRFAAEAAALTAGAAPAASVDEGAALMVERQRGLPPDELRARWARGAARLRQVLGGMDLSTRVAWVAGELSARTLATTRLAETWVHTGDIAEASGITLEPGARLRLIARLAWRTLPYAFASAGRTMAGPVAFRLVSPAGEPWDFVPEGDVVTTVRGPAAELCAVATRRLDAAATSLRGEGPDADDVLTLVRTYA